MTLLQRFNSQISVFKTPKTILLCLFLLLSSGNNDVVNSASTGRAGDLYQVGVGIGDVTGPAAEIGLVKKTFFVFPVFCSEVCMKSPS